MATLRARRTAAVFVLSVVWIVGLGAAVHAADELDQLNREQLEEQKLREEIRDLRADPLVWDRIGDALPLVTVLVAVIGAIATVWKQINETKRHREEADRQRSADRQEQRRRDEEAAEQRRNDQLEQRRRDEENTRQRELDRAQREKDARDRFDGRFAMVVAHLGSANLALQVSAAATLGIFLRDDYEEFYPEVYRLVLANLKVDHDRLVNRELVRVFEQVLRKRLDRLAEGETLLLDLDHAHLERLDLSGLTLPGLDIARSDLKHAVLRDAVMTGVQGFEAGLEDVKASRADLEWAGFKAIQARHGHFHETRLVNANLRDANLESAEFKHAELQTAKLERANLRSANFEYAAMRDTYLEGADLTDAVLDHADLFDAHLERATVVGATFSSANLERAGFEKADFGSGGARDKTMRSILAARKWTRARFDEQVRAELRTLEAGDTETTDSLATES